MVLTYQQSGVRKSQTVLISFLSLKGDVLEIRYCIPLVEDICIDGIKTNAYLRSLFFD